MLQRPFRCGPILWKKLNNERKIFVPVELCWKKGGVYWVRVARDTGKWQALLIPKLFEQPE
jgi:hypothetical protein